jgi:hypothetical protein
MDDLDDLDALAGLEHLTDPEELIEGARRCLRAALAALDALSAGLRGDTAAPRQERLNVVPLAARPTCPAPARRSTRTPRKRGAYPRRVE